MVANSKQVAFVSHCLMACVAGLFIDDLCCRIDFSSQLTLVAFIITSKTEVFDKKYQFTSL